MLVTYSVVVYVVQTVGVVYGVVLALVVALLVWYGIVVLVGVE